MTQALRATAICRCFNDLFGRRFHVVLQGGGQEPLYRPSRDGAPALIVAREDFAASALHEAAHWCIAGARRRALMDYGYDYDPPARGTAGQERFFAQERRVQAVECYLAAAAGVRFRASADDPDYSLQRLARFEEEVRQIADCFALADGSRRHDLSVDGRALAPQLPSPQLPPPRAREFAAALQKERSAA